MVINDFEIGNKCKISAIDTTLYNDMSVRLVNGTKWHKVKVYKADNILGYRFKVNKTMINEKSYVYDFSLILEHLLRMNITEDFRNKVQAQLKSLNYGITTSNGINIL